MRKDWLWAPGQSSEDTSPTQNKDHKGQVGASPTHGGVPFRAHTPHQRLKGGTEKWRCWSQTGAGIPAATCPRMPPFPRL